MQACAGKSVYIFLQASEAEDAYALYLHLGFEPLPVPLQSLPKEFREMVGDSEQPYIHFVTKTDKPDDTIGLQLLHLNRSIGKMQRAYKM